MTTWMGRFYTRLIFGTHTLMDNILDAKPASQFIKYEHNDPTTYFYILGIPKATL